MSTSKYIYHKLIATVLLSAVVFIALATAVSFNIEINRANQKTALMINQLLATIESTANVAMYANNAQIAQEVLEGLLRNDIIYKVVIRNDQNLHLEKAKGTITKQPDDIVRNLVSPFNNNRIIGQLIVTPNGWVSLNEARNRAFINALYALVLVGLTLLIMLILIRSFFSRPLQRLSNALNEMISGEQPQIKPLTHDENDELGFLVSGINKTLENLTIQQSLRRHIEAEEKKLRNIFESTSAGLFLLDEEGNVLVCTPTLQKITDCENVGLEAIAGQNFSQLFFDEPWQFQQLLKKADQFEQLETADLMLRSSATNPLWVHCLISKIIDSAGETRFEGVLFDISKRIAAEKAMRYAANYDSLTGVLRRNAAEEILKNQLALTPEIAPIILLLDLDGFKQANDNYGHDVGDIVLIQTARRLESCVRSGDIICRLGGDEFLIVLFSCTPITASFTIAEKIISSIRQPVIINANTTVNIGVSIGISYFPIHGQDVEALLKSADEAMYQVKRQGKNGYAIKSPNGSIEVTKPV